LNAGDAYFLVLYVVSVFQPVTRGDLLSEAIKAASGRDDSDFSRQTILEALKRLVRRQLVIEDRGLLSCTVLGNQRAAKLGLRKARDKNRLFFLKNVFRREYNESR
jgi:hypothetical protein